VADEARSADLVIISANRNGSSAELPGSIDPGDLAMHAGRPVLMVPPEADRLVLKNAMVA
jgi:phosphoribosylcarboxyaminoimidazole (NCAIR) mutase